MRSVGLLAIRKQTALDPSQKAIDTPRQAADDDQDKNDMFRQAAPLAGAQQIPQTMLGIDQLGQHDIPDGHAEERSKTLINVGQRQRNQHLADYLPLGS